MEKLREKLRLLVDGHDGSGKTTITKVLSDKLGGTIVRPLDSPFGVKILEAYKQGDESEIVRLFLDCMKKIEELNAEERVIIFDRGWLSVMTLLSEEGQNSLLEHIGMDEYSIYLCYASPEITEARLAERNDGKEKDWDNQKLCDSFLELAKKHGVTILDTTNSPDPESMVDLLLQSLN